MLSVSLDHQQGRALQLCQPGTIATFPWGRGSGKTFLGRLLIHTAALNKAGTHVGLLMPTLKQARQVFWPGLFDDYEGPLRQFIRGRPNKTLLEATYRNGSRLTTWGAENAATIRGQRFDVLIQDESDDIDPDVEQAVVRPTFSRAGVNALWVRFGTPRRGRNGTLYSSFRKALDGAPGYAGFKLRSEESLQVDQKWLAGVKSDTPPAIYSREYDVNFDASDGLVYGDVYVEEFHVRAPPKDVVWSEILIGADHGWEEPGCFLLIGVLGSGRDATLWVLDEYYERHRTEEWWKERLREWVGWYPQHRFYGDPSMPARLEAYRRDCSARVQEVDNTILDGIGTVADRFLIRSEYDEQGNETRKFARLYVAPGCKATRFELGAYRRKRDPKNPERFLEDIEDRNNHAMDALRYVALSRFGRPPSIRTSTPTEYALN